MTEPLRIICVSDTHDQQWRGVLEAPLEGDLLLHAGDATGHGSDPQLLAFDAWLARQRFPAKVFIPGNHDRGFEESWDHARGLVPSATEIPDQRVVDVAGLRVYGEPRQPEFCSWAFNVPRDDMHHVWRRVPPDIDVLLTHGPPLGACDRAHGRSLGCEAQREWIEEHQPPLVVCGHIHEGYGAARIGRTLVVNASTCDVYYEPVNPPIVVEWDGREMQLAETDR